jgi:hypothetical protein
MVLRRLFEITRRNSLFIMPAAFAGQVFRGGSSTSLNPLQNPVRVATGSLTLFYQLSRIVPMESVKGDDDVSA